MLDYLGIFKEFNKKKIRYIVVGGMAVNLLGIPRITYDIDLLLDLEDENLMKFLRLMKIWGFKPKAPVNIIDFANRDKREKWIKNKHMKAFNLVNPDWAIREIDIIINTPVNYKSAIKNIRRAILYKESIPIISAKDLILMKSKSNRAQDRDDIVNLKKILK